jgi:hypothetical protein
MLADLEWRGVEPGPTRVSVPNALMQLGEGQPLYLEQIPNISLVTVPQYLLTTEPGDYVDIPLLRRQVDSFGRLLRRLDTLPAASVGSIAPHTALRKISAGATMVTRLVAK